MTPQGVPYAPAVVGVSIGTVLFLVIVGTTIWVGYDHAAADRVMGRSFGDSTTFWVVACLLLWIVAFPWYLVHRQSRRTAFLTPLDLDDEETDYQPPAAAFCGACGTQQALPGDRFCRGCGASLGMD